MHIDSARERKTTSYFPTLSHGRERTTSLLVNVYPDGHPEEGKRMYAMIDVQSNRSLAKSNFFSLSSIKNGEMEYTIYSCAGNLTASGRQASGFTVESLDGNTLHA